MVEFKDPVCTAGGSVCPYTAGRTGGSLDLLPHALVKHENNELILLGSRRGYCGHKGRGLRMRLKKTGRP